MKPIIYASQQRQENVSFSKSPLFSIHVELKDIWAHDLILFNCLEFKQKDILKLFYIEEMSSLATSAASNEQQKTINKYKEKASLLFEKLQNLQEIAESNKSEKQQQLIHVFEKTEKKVLENCKVKQGWYSNILQMVKDIEDELYNQRSEEEKCQRSVHVWLESTERQLNQQFQKIVKEATKSEANLEKFVESKVQSFVLKNKFAWNQGSLINQEPYIEEINFLAKEHQKYLGDFQKECEKLKKDTFDSIKECARFVNEEINNSSDSQLVAEMNATHMEFTAKLKSLKEQRERTEERVLAMLEKVVRSCIGTSDK